MPRLLHHISVRYHLLSIEAYFIGPMGKYII